MPIVIIKSPPGSPAAADAVSRAATLAADIVLEADAAGLALKDMLKGFCGTAFVNAEDAGERLPAGAELEKGVRLLTGEEMEALLAGQEVLGPY